MKAKRIQKIKNFESFYDNCIAIFTELRDNDDRAKIFQKEYMLNICPGSRIGGEEKRIIEVFWGARAYDFETKGNNWRSLSETGTTLFFYRNDTGDITISLYPAKTENRQPVENYIALYEWLDPRKLNDKTFVESLWKDFMAYMECTSLDGKPTYKQTLRISYLRNFKHLVVKNTWQPRKATKFATVIFQWVLTVGLSGIIIFFVTVWSRPDSTEEELQLIKINKNLEDISNRLMIFEETKKDIESISSALDSLKINRTNNINY